MKKPVALIAASLALAGATPAHAVEYITNGAFASGLTGWTTYLTPNGAASQTTTSFNVTGSATNAALQLRTGRTSGGSIVATPAGGGVFQMINITQAGSYSFTANYASSAGGGGTLAGGIFALMMNDVAVSSFNTGFVSGVERGNLNYTVNLAPGLYKIGVQVTRPLAPTGNPRQYFDNVSLVGPPPLQVVPEPGTWALMLAGFGVVGGMLRRKRVTARVRFT